MFTWIAAGGGGGPFSWRELLGDVHGPLFTAAVHQSMRAFGETEWALRLPAAVAGVLTVPAMAWVAARWLGRETAAPAAWLAAFSPFLVRYAQEARGYAWGMLAACVSVALLLELRRRCDARGVAAWAAATAFGALANPAFLLLAPLHLRLWLAGDPATRRARRRALAVVAVALAALLAPLAPAVLRTWDWSRLAPGRAPAAGEAPLRGATTLHPGALPYAAYTFAVGATLGPSTRELRAGLGPGTFRRHAPAVAAVAVTFGAAGALGALALARRRRLLDGVVWLAAPALVVVYFAAQNFKVFNPRYLAVSAPAFLLVAAAAWADRGAAGRRWLGGAVAVLWAVSLHHHYFDPRYEREDYRAALAAVRSAIAPGEQVLAVGAVEPVEFYARDLPVERLWLGFAADTARLERELDAVLSRAQGSWVVLSREEDLDPDGRFARKMERIAAGAPGTHPGVRVWHVTRTAGGAQAPAAPR